MTLLINLIYIRGTARDWKVFFSLHFSLCMPEASTSYCGKRSNYHLVIDCYHFPWHSQLFFFFIKNIILWEEKCHDMLLVLRFLVMNVGCVGCSFKWCCAIARNSIKISKKGHFNKMILQGWFLCMFYLNLYLSVAESG